MGIRKKVGLSRSGISWGYKVPVGAEPTPASCYTCPSPHFVSKNRVYLQRPEIEHLSSWIEQCPYLMGPNWSSSLEVAIRLINWSIAWVMIGGHQSEFFSEGTDQKFKEAWLGCIYQHLSFISGNLSGFSSANNHLIGEAAGLFIGANTWPYWRKTDRPVAICRS